MLLKVLGIGWLLHQEHVEGGRESGWRSLVEWESAAEFYFNLEAFVKRIVLHIMYSCFLSVYF